MPSFFRFPKPQFMAALVFLLSFCHDSGIIACAEVQITGDADAVQIEAREATVEEVLGALNEAFGLQYRSSRELSRSVSGTFSGSLREVVSRVLLLQGYNFVTESSAGRTMVAVYDFGTSSGSNSNILPTVAAKSPAQSSSPVQPAPPRSNLQAFEHAPPQIRRRVMPFSEQRVQKN
ncbi:MAG TPA: hypothetical protein VEK34_14960 [Methylocella sp.]|nr:hypothetical protein [Methylocella sp.]